MNNFINKFDIIRNVCIIIILIIIYIMNVINDREPIEQDNVENVMAIVLSFMENAVQDASTYVEHSGRKIVCKKDIRMALQAETFEFMNRQDTEGSLMYYKESVHNDIGNYNDPDYEDSDEDEDVNEFLNKKVVKDSEMEKYCKSLCKCPVCTRMNLAVRVWDTWTPITDMEKVLKKVIDTKI